MTKPRPKLDGQEKLEQACRKLKYLLPKQKPNIKRHARSFLYGCIRIKSVDTLHTKNHWTNRGSARARADLSGILKTLKKLKVKLKKMEGGAFELLLARPDHFEEDLEEFIELTERALKKLDTVNEPAQRGLPKTYETQVTQEIRRLYTTLTGQERGRSLDGHLPRFIREVFEILGIKADLDHHLRKATASARKEPPRIQPSISLKSSSSTSLASGLKWL